MVFPSRTCSKFLDLSTYLLSVVQIAKKKIKKHLNYSNVKKLSGGVARGMQSTSKGHNDYTVRPMGKQTRIPFSKSGSRIVGSDPFGRSGTNGDTVTIWEPLLRDVH